MDDFDSLYYWEGRCLDAIDDGDKSCWGDDNIPDDGETNHEQKMTEKQINNHVKDMMKTQLRAAEIHLKESLDELDSAERLAPIGNKVRFLGDFIAETLKDADKEWQRLMEQADL